MRPLLLAAAVALLVTPLIAQERNVYPLSPISPKSSQECQAFEARVNQISAAYDEEHTKCLADHHKDPSVPAVLGPQSHLVCSKTACQGLHDIVYGSEKDEVQARLGECNKMVRDYQTQLQEEQAARQRAIDAQVSAVNAQTNAANQESQRLEQAASQERQLMQQSTDQAQAFRDEAQAIRQQGIQVNEGALDDLSQPTTQESIFGTFAEATLAPAEDASLADYLVDAKQRASEFAQEKIIEPLKKGMPEWAADELSEPASKIVQASEEIYDLYSSGRDIFSAWRRIEGADPSDSVRALGDAGSLVADHVFSNPIQSEITKKTLPFIGETSGNAFGVFDAVFQRWQGDAPEAATAEMLDDYALVFPGVKQLNAFKTKLDTSYAYFKNLFGSNSSP